MLLFPTSSFNLLAESLKFLSWSVWLAYFLGKIISWQQITSGQRHAVLIAKFSLGFFVTLKGRTTKQCSKQIQPVKENTFILRCVESYSIDLFMLWLTGNCHVICIFTRCNIFIHSLVVHVFFDPCCLQHKFIILNIKYICSA